MAKIERGDISVTTPEDGCANRDFFLLGLLIFLLSDANSRKGENHGQRKNK
jgi:hypothetical protein